MPSLVQKAVSAFLHPGGPYLFVRIVTVSYAISAIARLVPVRRKQVPGFRRRPGRMMVLTVVGVVAACAIGAGTYVLPRYGRGRAGAKPLPAAQGPAVSTRLGVFEPDEWSTFQPVERFATAAGKQPGIILIYSGWPEPFQQHFAAMAYAHHAEPFVQMEPVGTRLDSIAAGSSDAYLRSYAAQVRSYGHPVMLSFGPEMDGGWYSWGAHHTPASVFVKAWRHVVTVFRTSRANNVTWLWTVFSTQHIRASLRAWWPGSRWVNTVGIDGYYYRQSDTFASVFAATVSQIRKFTRDPILITETSAGPRTGDQPGKITNLFAGIHASKLLGLVWFDQAQHDGIYHQDWRLEDSPAAAAAFRRAATRYLDPLP